jgi:hypothetical protein
VKATALVNGVRHVFVLKSNKCFKLKKINYVLREAMTIEVDLKEIKSLLLEVNSKLDSLLEEKGSCALVALEENSLKGFLEGEPDIYSVIDIKAKVKGN